MNEKRWTTFVLLLLPSALLADTVYLKGGGKISGRIVTRTDTGVQVDVGAGTIDVSMTNVDRIVIFPFSIETGAVARPERLKIGIEAIEVNPSLDEARFQVPTLER